MGKLFCIDEIGSKPCTQPIPIFFLEWVDLGDKQKATGLELAPFPSRQPEHFSICLLRGCGFIFNGVCAHPWPHVTLHSPQGASAEKDYLQRIVPVSWVVLSLSSLLQVRKLRHIEVSTFPSAS